MLKNVKSTPRDIISRAEDYTMAPCPKMAKFYFIAPIDIALRKASYPPQTEARYGTLGLFL